MRVQSVLPLLTSVNQTPMSRQAELQLNEPSCFCEASRVWLQPSSSKASQAWRPSPFASITSPLAAGLGNGLHHTSKTAFSNQAMLFVAVNHNVWVSCLSGSEALVWDTESVISSSWFTSLCAEEDHDWGVLVMEMLSDVWKILTYTLTHPHKHLPTSFSCFFLEAFTSLHSFSRTTQSVRWRLPSLLCTIAKVLCLHLFPVIKVVA